MCILDYPKVSLVVSVSVSGLYLLTLLKVFYLIPRVLSRLMIKLLEIFGTLQLTALLTSASCNSLPPQTNWSEAATAASQHRYYLVVIVFKWAQIYCENLCKVLHLIAILRIFRHCLSKVHQKH